MATWEEVVALCEAELPEVERSTSYGTPALKVKGKLFARLKEDEERIAVFVDFIEREVLIESWRKRAPKRLVAEYDVPP